MGVAVNGQYLNTESGLTPLLDRLTASFDADSLNRAQQRGLANASYAGLTPADAPATGILSRLLGTAGLAPQPAPPGPSRAAVPAATPALTQGTPSPVGPPAPGFDSAVTRTLGFEGGLNPKDTNGTPSNYGINQAAHPDVNVATITPDQAKSIYKTGYWDKIGADQMPPALARAAFDTAVIAGPGKAQELLAQSGGDPQKFMDLREQFQNGLIQQDPQKYGQYGKAWANRNMGLRTDIAALNWQQSQQQPASSTAYAPQSAATGTPAQQAIATATGQQAVPSQQPMPVATADPGTPGPGSPPPQVMASNGNMPSAPAAAAPPSLPVATSSPSAPGPAAQASQMDASGQPQMPSLGQIRQLVLEPATRQLGLQLWQQYLTPKDGFTLKQGEARYDARGRQIAGMPAAPVAIREGGALVDPSHPGTPLYVNPKTETGTFQTPDGATYSFDKNNPSAAPIRLTPQGLPSGYRPANADERKALGVAPTTPLFFGPDGKPSTLAGGTQVTVNNAVNPILKGLGDQFVENAADARSSADTVRAVQNARTQLNGGIISGAGADQVLGLRKIGLALGIGDPDKVVNTETFRTQIKPIVLSTVKGLGAGSGISNADRDFAEAAVGGKITLDAGTISRVLDITERSARAKIDRHNVLADQMIKTQPDLGAVAPMLHITPPPMSNQAAPQPASQDTSPIGQAKAAIAAGAPRDAVIQRLQQQGVDISGQGL